MNGLIELANSAVVVAPKPQGSTHRGMRRRIVGIGLQSLPRGFKRQSNLAFALPRLQQERVLKMRKR